MKNTHSSHTSSPPASKFQPPRRFILIATLLIALLNAYIGSRLLPPLQLEFGAMLLGVILFGLSTALILLGLLARLLPKRLPESVLRGLTWCGLIASGFFSSLLVLTVLRDVFLLVASGIASADTNLWMQHDSVYLVLGLSLIASGIGFHHARRTPKVVEVNVRLTNLPLPLQSLRIVQLSDIHVGPTITREFLQPIIQQVNALNPHLIVITGDLVDGSVQDLAAHTDILQELRSTYGSFFVTGNHEYYSGAEAWVQELRRIGITVLQNEHVVLQHQGVALVLAGVNDYAAHHFGEQHRSDPQAALRGAPVDAIKILLAHQPRSAPAAAAAGFHLQLSGHTHGGQFFPWNFFVPLQQPFTAGLHQLNKLWIYTSRGTGYWGPPKRLFAPAEITLLRLVSS